MSILKKSASAIGKLLSVAVLAAAFFFGLVGVVYMSLQGEELEVPKIVGKDFTESEQELAKLGLKIKKRADRYSKEKQNTVLEQRPKAGEIVKTGQMILVVVSKENPDGEEAPATLESNEEDDIEKIEELISDKPKTDSKKSSNQDKKKTIKTRDVKVEKKEKDEDKTDTGGTDTAEKSGDATTETKTDTGGETKTEAPVKTTTDKKPTDKPKTDADPPKPKADKPKDNGETRPRIKP